MLSSKFYCCVSNDKTPVEQLLLRLDWFKNYRNCNVSSRTTWINWLILLPPSWNQTFVTFYEPSMTTNFFTTIARYRHNPIRWYTKNTSALKDRRIDGSYTTVHDMWTEYSDQDGASSVAGICQTVSGIGYKNEPPREVRRIWENGLHTRRVFYH